MRLDHCRWGKAVWWVWARRRASLSHRGWQAWAMVWAWVSIAAGVVVVAGQSVGGLVWGWASDEGLGWDCWLRWR